MFIHGIEIYFDGSGIGHTSGYNPVWQYNSSKLNNYRIDFFIVANASGHHILYTKMMCTMRKMKAIYNSSQPEEISNKNSLNEIVPTGLYNDTN